MKKINILLIFLFLITLCSCKEDEKEETPIKVMTYEEFQNAPFGSKVMIDSYVQAYSRNLNYLDSDNYFIFTQDKQGNGYIIYNYDYLILKQLSLQDGKEIVAEGIKSNIDGLIVIADAVIKVKEDNYLAETPVYDFQGNYSENVEVILNDLEIVASKDKNQEVNYIKKASNQNYFENIEYDSVKKLPKLENHPVITQEDIISQEIFVREGFYNKYNEDAAGGIFIFSARAKTDKIVNLEIYDDINFTKADNYHLNINIPNLDLSSSDAYKYDETKLSATKFGEYRIYLEYGKFTEDSKPMNQKRIDTKELVLKDWSFDTGEFDLNISEAIANASLDVVINGKIKIDLKSDINNITYVPIQSLSFQTTSKDEEILDKLTYMGLVDYNNVEKEGYDANTRSMLNMLQNPSAFPKGYWRTTGVKNVYHNQVYLCNFLYQSERIYYIKASYNNITYTFMLHPDILFKLNTSKNLEKDITDLKIGDKINIKCIMCKYNNVDGLITAILPNE